MDQESAANFYEQDSSDLLKFINTRTPLPGDPPWEWLEEQAASQLSAANACRGFIR